MKIPPPIARRSVSQAFSLIELLVVVAIIGLLATLTGPAISALAMGGSMNRTANNVSMELEEARAFAMAHNTYVWIGFYQDTTEKSLLMGVIAGTSGQSTDLKSSTYAPISKVQTYPNCALSSNLSLPGMAADAADLTGSSGVFQMTSGGKPIRLSSVLQFNPRGEASLVPVDPNQVPQGSVARWFKLGLQPAQGNNTSNPDNAVIQVSRLTGQVVLLRR